MIALKGTKRYHAFIDESEFKQDKLTSIGTLLIPVEKMAAVERDVNQLRNTIGRKMRREKYMAYFGSAEDLKKHKCASEAKRLRSGELPELHAKEIWQSQGAYFCERTLDAKSRRDEWISRIVKIIEKHQLVWFVRNFNGKQREFGKREIGDNSFLSPYITKDISSKKLDELARRC